MENTIIKVRFVETKAAQKTGNMYATITSADDVRYTCHEKEIYDNLQPDHTYKIEYTVSGNWKNIKSAEEVKEEAVKANPDITTTGNVERIVDARAAKDTSIYTSYCKDLFIACLPAEKPKEVMQTCIDLIKQARQAFS